MAVAPLQRVQVHQFQRDDLGRGDSSLLACEVEEEDGDDGDDGDGDDDGQANFNCSKSRNHNYDHNSGLLQADAADFVIWGKP